MTPISSSVRALLAAILLGSPLLAQSGSIQGTVRSHGGALLEGMVVAAYNSEGEVARETFSNANGGYVLPLPAATYRILAYDKQGYWATSFYDDASSFETSAEITLASGQYLSGIDLRVVRAAQVYGTVRSSSGALLKGMTVSAYNLDGTRRGHQKTDDSGAYSLAVPAGQYKLVAWDDALRFAPGFYSNATSFDSASTVSVTSSSPVRISFTLRPAAKVSGNVVSEATGQPLGGIDILAYDVATGEGMSHTATLPEGDFVLGLSAGHYKFAAADPSGRYATEFFLNSPSFGAAASFDLAEGAARGGIDFTLAELTEPPPPTTLFIPAVINAPGGEGSYWRTDVWIYNPTQLSAMVTATYFSGAAAGVDTQIAIPPRGQVEIPNILGTLFAAGGVGSLRLSAPLPFVAVSRTFNTPPNASEVGTFGFSIAAMDTGATLGLAVLQGVAQGSAYRTNVGMMNPHDHEVTVRARLYSASGALLGEASVPLAALTVQQPALTDLFGAAIQVTGGYVILSSDGGSFFSYASVVDNKSNDPTLVLPTADRP